ncbi:hypothetical protein [Cohnella herbarum]|uniref:Uncharacterized protein n=1 Tax=Cohnella herbarum TaxID=2728023 RepID=A0A7Z2VJ45_9BACL|nr:hypothetical protein [Cohnella herbarum]QJD83920.1 hypothetical protein HH215_12490 [Cohnella herbarum]
MNTTVTLWRLIFAGSVLTVSFYRKDIHLGATRKEQDLGVLPIYFTWSVVFAIFNVIWLIGWILWGILIAAIPAGMSVPSVRVHSTHLFQLLLLDDSLLEGFELAIILSCIFLVGGWLFTSRRKFLEGR